MEPGAVLVALDGHGTDVDFDVEVLGTALHDLAHEPELVRHVDFDAGADLDFVLAAHHFAVGARDVEACHQALNSSASENRRPKLFSPSTGHAKGPAACVEDFLGSVPDVGLAWLGHVEVSVGLAEEDDVRRGAERIRAVLDGPEKDFGVVAGRLFGGRAVEVPRSRQLVDDGDAGAVVERLGFAAQLEFAAQPDLLRKHT